MATTQDPSAGLQRTLGQPRFPWVTLGMSMLCLVSPSWAKYGIPDPETRPKNSSYGVIGLSLGSDMPRHHSTSCDLLAKNVLAHP